MLVGGVAVPAGKGLVGGEGGAVMVDFALQPDNLAVVLAVVIEVAAAESEGERAAFVASREVGGIGVVGHGLAIDEVAAAEAEGQGVHTVAVNFPVAFVALGVAEAVGVVEGGVEGPEVAEEVGVVELVVLLFVVVGLEGVVGHVAELVFDFAAAVVAGVGVELLGRGSVPGDAAVLFAEDGDEFEHGAVAVVAGGEEEALLVGLTAADEAVGGEAVVGGIEREAVCGDAGAGHNAILAGVPRAPREVGGGVWLGGGVEGLQIHGTAEGCGTAVAGTHAALQLHALAHAAQVGDVVPIDRLALGIVEGDTVDVDVDAGGVDTANAQIGDTHGAVFGRGDHTGLKLEHVG